MTTTSQQPAMTSPVMHRRRLGAQLRDLRESRCLRLEDAAAALGVAPSTLSRIETGRAPTRTSYLTLLLDLYGMTDKEQRRHLADSARAGQRKEWWWDDRDLLPAGAGIYFGLEATASTACSYSPFTIPDLLQTSEYTVALIRATRPGLTRDQIKRLASLTQRRQEQLHDTRCHHLVLDESTLLRELGSVHTMKDQLKHLANATAKPAIIQVMALTPAQPLVTGAFSILIFSDPADPGAVCYHFPNGQTTISKREAQVNDARTMFTTLVRAAMPPAESVDLIKKLASA
jgi:transcriptional regulator with XRE-family HTH domain